MKEFARAAHLISFTPSLFSLRMGREIESELKLKSNGAPAVLRESKASEQWRQATKQGRWAECCLLVGYGWEPGRTANKEDEPSPSTLSFFNSTTNSFFLGCGWKSQRKNGVGLLVWVRERVGWSFLFFGGLRAGRPAIGSAQRREQRQATHPN